jgi:hypothetical protein
MLLQFRVTFVNMVLDILGATKIMHVVSEFSLV